MWRTRWTGPAVVALLGALSACQAVAGSDVVCTEEAVPGIRLDVLDSATRAPAGSGSLAIARDGAFADTARPFVPHGNTGEIQTLFLAVERRGTYQGSSARGTCGGRAPTCGSWGTGATSGPSS